MKKTASLFLTLLLVWFTGLGFSACSQEEPRVPIRPQKETKVNANSQQQHPHNTSYSKTHTNSIGMEFVLVPAGNFMMGCDRTVDKCNDDETPPHTVMIAKPFYLGKYEVTQAQWRRVMGHTPSKFVDKTKPVEQVSWNDVQAFIQKLNEKEKTDQYRLPTEAEWEYAARAGSTGAYWFGSNLMELKRYAWHGGDYESTDGTHPVGQLKPNPWGLYDMHGNVWEWVQDVYQDRYVVSPDADLNELSEPSPGDLRVIRGGSWANAASRSRSAFRNSREPNYRSRTIGFRLVFSPERQQPPEPVSPEETAPEQTPAPTAESKPDEPPVSGQDVVKGGI